MIRIERTPNMKLVKDILTAPGLYEEIIADGSPSKEEYEADPNSLYLIPIRDYKILGVFCLHAVNSITFEAHINILPAYWGERIDEATHKAIEWISENTTALKLIAWVPETCPQVIAATLRYGFKEEGFSPLSIKRKDKVIGQYLFGLELEKDHG